MSKKTRVVFLRQHGAYVNGDIAGFDDKAFKRLQAMKPPVIAECDDDGNPLRGADAVAEAAKPAAQKKAAKPAAPKKAATPAAPKDPTPEPGAPPVQGAK